MQKRIHEKFNISPKIIIISTVFLDVLGIGLIIPVLPFYVESFNVSHNVVTALFAVFALFSFFSATDIEEVRRAMASADATDFLLVLKWNPLWLAVPGSVAGTPFICLSIECILT